MYLQLAFNECYTKVPNALDWMIGLRVIEMAFKYCWPHSNNFTMI